MPLHRIITRHMTYFRECVIILRLKLQSENAQKLIIHCNKLASDKCQMEMSTVKGTARPDR